MRRSLDLRSREDFRERNELRNRKDIGNEPTIQCHHLDLHKDSCFARCLYNRQEKRSTVYHSLN